MKDESKNCEQTARVGPSDPEMLLLRKDFLEDISQHSSPQKPVMHRRMFMYYILVHFIWWRNVLRSWLRK